MAEPKQAPAKDVPAAKAFVPPKVLKRVTLQVLKIDAGMTVYLKFLTAIIAKPKLEKNDKGEMVEKKIDIAQVCNLETGEVVQIVVGEVLKKELMENYPKDAYVGKAFKIEKRNVESKRYKNYLIDEVEG